ncbi:stage III sporulation protein AA [Capillibacterium thermochitinicola]|uniref:Stage III sporulation protein AA n=1 Tax=Capillibacterium thermochitinicola TaxID=2699427 RepID=A0A8J6HZX8_9FIRM|nr:stage III sporulation protein AA [Capillibacterium thermochitinicola]
MVDYAEQVLPFLVPRIRWALERFRRAVPEKWAKLEEIRLRAEQPLQVEVGESLLVTADGVPTIRPEQALKVEAPDVLRTVQLMGGNSLYTLEEELREGFITLAGGHRVGLAGECLVGRGALLRLKRVTSINIRIARQLKGIGRRLLPYLTMGDRPLRTIIISPPQAGKTTLLRDLVRSFSNGEGVPAPVKVGLVDERGEVAGSYRGVPQLDVGMRTDVLTGCPKREGVFLLLRSMGPQLIATDEIGRPGDLDLIEEILNMGVGFITTAHAWDTKDFARRPSLQRLWSRGLVERVVLLSRRLGPGTLEGVWNGQTKEALLSEVQRLEVKR